MAQWFSFLPLEELVLKAFCNASLYACLVLGGEHMFPLSVVCHQIWTVKERVTRKKKSRREDKTGRETAKTLGNNSRMAQIKD